MDLEQLFLRISNVKSFSSYNNVDVLLDFNLKHLTCEKGYQKAMIKLPKTLVYTEEMLRVISKQFKNTVKVVLYEREYFKSYFLDVYFIDRDLKNDFSYATSDMVMYKSSNKRMKDISKYNPKNENHYYITKGEKVPEFQSKKIKYNKKRKWSTLKVRSKKHFNARNHQRKLIISIYINKLLKNIGVNKKYVTAKKWGELGLEFMWRVEQQVLSNNPGKSRKELYHLIEYFKDKAREKNENLIIVCIKKKKIYE